MEVIRTYIRTSNLRPFINNGLATYLLTIQGSSIGTSEISSIINIPLPWLELVGFIIHAF